jgi:hypothetical protein
VLNEVLAFLRLDKHPDTTLTGRIEKGFDFLGYRFGSQVLKVAEATIKRFLEHATQLYEQRQRKRKKAPLPGRYVRRCLGWSDGALKPRHAHIGVPVCLAGHRIIYALVPTSQSPPLIGGLSNEAGGGLAARPERRDTHRRCELGGRTMTRISGFHAYIVFQVVRIRYGFV